MKTPTSSGENWATQARVIFPPQSTENVSVRSKSNSDSPNSKRRSKYVEAGSTWTTGGFWGQLDKASISGNLVKLVPLYQKESFPYLWQTDTWWYLLAYQSACWHPGSLSMAHFQVSSAHFQVFPGFLPLCTSSPTLNLL